MIAPTIIFNTEINEWHRLSKGQHKYHLLFVILIDGMFQHFSSTKVPVDNFYIFFLSKEAYIVLMLCLSCAVNFTCLKDALPLDALPARLRLTLLLACFCHFQPIHNSSSCIIPTSFVFHYCSVKHCWFIQMMLQIVCCLCFIRIKRCLCYTSVNVLLHAYSI